MTPSQALHIASQLSLQNGVISFMNGNKGSRVRALCCSTYVSTEIAHQVRKFVGCVCEKKQSQLAAICNLYFANNLSFLQNTNYSGKPFLCNYHICKALDQPTKSENTS